MEAKVIAAGAKAMAALDPERTLEEHERYVRGVLDSIQEHLVLRSLYDAVIAELRPSS